MKVFKNFIKEAKKADTMIIQRENGITTLCSGVYALQVPDIVYNECLSELPFPHCEENSTISRRGKKSNFGQCNHHDFNRIFEANETLQPVRITPYKKEYTDKEDIRLLLGHNGNEDTVIGINEKYLKAFDMFAVWESTGSPTSPIYANSDTWRAIILPIRLGYENAPALLSFMGELFEEEDVL